MTQKRIEDYGAPIVAKSLKVMNYSFTSAAVLRGYEFVVDSASRIRINPGEAVTNQGVIIIEDEPKYLTIVNTSIPVDYTIYYKHTDADISGGVPAELIIEPGLYTAETIAGVILGYIRYPGGGIPLAASHFIEVQALQLGEERYTRESAKWLIPIRGQGYLLTGTSGSSITTTDVWDSGSMSMYVKFRNNNLTTGGITIIFPFKVDSDPYALLQIIIGTDINATLTPSFIDSEGNILVLLTTPFTGVPTLTLQNVSIPRATIQHPNTIVYIQLQMQLAASREIKLKALGLNKFNLPV